MNILLTGVTGQLGHDLALSLGGLGHITAVSRKEMDLEDINQIRAVIRSVKPDLIVNPAAYTAVALAETDIDRATRINTIAPTIMAQEAQRLGAGILHFSTDYVFDGTFEAAYTEDMQPAPLNIYGKTKYEGELAIAQHCEQHWIFRTSWLYGMHGNSFLKTVIRLAQEKSTLSMVNDQVGAPTWTRSLSEITRQVLAGKQSMPDAPLAHLNGTTGTYHVSASGETSWHAYAAFIVDQLLALKVPTKIADSASILAVASTSSTSTLVRPLNSRLSTAKLNSVFQITPAPWDIDVRTCIKEMVDAYQLAAGKPLPTT